MQAEASSLESWPSTGNTSTNVHFFYCDFAQKTNNTHNNFTSAAVLIVKKVILLFYCDRLLFGVSGYTEHKHFLDLK